ncbi:unnamed protein product [Mytilus coruscus]|uniref:PML C-terminal domain-containing protein n=1 Tax=Mytilus coruscus TaxID=42192 RepID=A0A6J8B337_MYTCO|nr:unnamed protein product [Mytilus coruscus]
MIKQSILALCDHPFRQHQSCNNSWCKFLDNPNEKFSSLPHGKPLSDGALQNALRSVFTTYAGNAGKLSSLGSTQQNESFNRIVASKAPKQQHYSSSGSLKFRIAACVAQKNEGNKFILDVNKNISVSPGYFTQRLAVLRDLQHRKRKAIANTYKFKQRRRNLKSTRHQKLATKEVREGVTYSSGIGLEDHPSDDIEEIPSPSLQPAYKMIEWTTKVNQIFFDIEATGLARNSHITQISATSDKGSINTYVLPKKPITPKAQEITGIKVEGSKMFCNDKEVKSKTKLLLPTLTPLTEKKIIISRTANVIAASGMSFSHLLLSYARDGRQGIEDVLKEEDVNGKVRVTKSKKIVDAISDFFKSLKPEA